MIVIFQILAGIVLGLGSIVAVFWFTFRRPPPSRSGDNTNSSFLTSDPDLGPGSHDGHGGHF